jgi:2-isopropylmalate synthase
MAVVQQSESAPPRDAMPNSFHVFDTTLRDGAQREGISYSVADKLAIARLLDGYGVGFIEGGWPGAMPKDTEFFARAHTELEFKHAQLVAFGATRKAGVAVQDDLQVQALLDSLAPVVTIVAKSDVRHVDRALRTTPAENVAMVVDTVSHLVAAGRRVFVDFEHFFDGYTHDADYGVELLKAAAQAGAEVGVLCDTNGGMLPSDITQVVTDVLARSGVRIGIHCQDDTGCAVANTIAAVQAGATHVQGTANGYGERTGNADLFVVVANLELKLGMGVLPAGCLAESVSISHAIAAIANLTADTHQPYAGVSSFSHKAGLHASALKVSQDLYNHIDPKLVGNDMRILITEMAGRASVELKGKELGYDLSHEPEALAGLVDRVKDLEAQGWSFEAADASFELMLLDQTGGLNSEYELESWRTIVERKGNGSVVSEATVKLIVDGRREISTAEGNGPVNALDNALRGALIQAHPQLESLRLVDYKVRILEGVKGTGAVTRVLVSTTNGDTDWHTVGVHENVIEASWLALDDAIRFGLLTAK